MLSGRCQGRSACSPNAQYLAALEPDACQYGAGSNVSMCVYLRLRHRKTSGVTNCRDQAEYHPETQTCYRLTGPADSWNRQRERCRGAGGDLTYLPSNTSYPGLVGFLRDLTSDHAGNLSAVWVAGRSQEPRPVVDMRASVVQDAADLCLRLETGGLYRCPGDARLYAVCALPPWPQKETHNCSRVTFQQYGLTFPETEAGRTASQPCGEGYTGTDRYTCGMDGEWSTRLPDLS